MQTLPRHMKLTKFLVFFLSTKNNIVLSIFIFNKALKLHFKKINHGQKITRRVQMHFHSTKEFTLKIQIQNTKQS